MSYCDLAIGHPDHGPYHDREYGFPVRDDDRLFERLVLEINQAGLSWLTILRKREAFHEAFDSFSLEKVARYDARRRGPRSSNRPVLLRGASTVSSSRVLRRKRCVRSATGSIQRARS